MRSRVSYRFQIDSSYTCVRAKTMRKRYEWTRIVLKTKKKVAFSNEYGYVWTGPYRFLQAADWPTANFRGTYCYFPVIL